MKKPTLIYDGDCHFCQYCADYLKKITRGNLQFLDFNQDSLGIDKKKCAKSIYLVVNPNEIHHGAAAGLKALSYGDLNQGWWLYQNLIGFKPLTEGLYKWITNHRELVFKIAKIVCGNPWQVGRITFVFWALITLILIIGLTLKSL